MKILADMHISPVTVRFLRSLGHDVIRVNEIISSCSPDKSIIKTAVNNNMVILTQDLDFSEIIALSGNTEPSLISLRLSSSRVDYVNSVLERVIPKVEGAVKTGAIVSVEDNRIRVRKLPL